MKKFITLFSLLLVLALVLAACGGAATPPPQESEPAAQEEAAEEPAAEEVATEEAMAEEAVATEEAMAEEAAATEEAMAEESGEAMPAGDVTFFSTQFVPVEEQEVFRDILSAGGFDVIGSEEGPLLDVVLAGQQAGQGDIDVIGALHGTFPPLAREDALMNMIDIAEDLLDTRELTPAYLETGLLGTDDYLYYVPWMQATYIMAAHKDALEYLPEGADINALTWEQFSTWCQTLMEETGEPRCGMPHAGLFHRFLEGYMWPSFTGGMATQFKSAEAAAMMEWARDSLWPYVSPNSINYEFMQEPLLAGEVWVAFDHTARLLDALNAEPDNFVTFPAPAGPAGRGFMPVIVGLGIPNTAPDPEGGAKLIDYLTTPEVQGQILEQLGFFPVVSGVDTSNLPAGIALEADAVELQSSSSDALPALLPVGLGERGGEINQIYRNAFDRIVLEGEDIQTVLDEEGANLQALFDETGAPCWSPDPPSDGPCQVE
ncbi:MAG: extracellular solute-binding protein [Anaerolineales bacterium]|nr:extracellular solute-binding protein [Anaerolineales bacterium]